MYSLKLTETAPRAPITTRITITIIIIIITIIIILSLLFYYYFFKQLKESFEF